MLNEELFVNLITSILLIGALGVFLQTTNLYINVNTKFKLQHDKLVSKYYLQNDIITSTDISFCSITDNQVLGDCDRDFIPNRNSIKINSHIILLHTQTEIVAYYLKKSVVNKSTYALYRDDLRQNAKALVENVSGLQLVNDNMKLTINVAFADNIVLEIKCLQKLLAIY